MPPTPTSPARKGLDTMPLEVREKIYHYLVANKAWIRPIDTEYMIGGGLNPGYEWLRPVSPVDHSGHAVSRILDTSTLRVSMQIFNEANHVLLRDGKIMWLNKDGLPKSIEKRRAAIFGTARHLTLILYGTLRKDDSLCILEQRTKLRTLRVFLRIPPGTFGVTNSLRMMDAFENVRACAMISFNSWDEEVQESRPAWKLLGKSMMKQCRCEKDGNGEHIDDVSFGVVDSVGFSPFRLSGAARYFAGIAHP